MIYSARLFLFNQVYSQVELKDQIYCTNDRYDFAYSKKLSLQARHFTFIFKCTLQ